MAGSPSVRVPSSEPNPFSVKKKIPIDPLTMEDGGRELGRAEEEMR